MSKDLTPIRRTPTRADRAGLIGFMIAGAAIVVWAVIDAVLTIVAAVTSPTVAVVGEFDGTPARAPIGPDGTDVEVALESAVLSTTELPIASLVSLVLAEVVVAAAITIVVACLLMLSASVLRGRVFSRRNSWLVTVASLAGLLGAAGSPFFLNMAANGAFAAISNGDFDNEIMTLDLFPYVLACFVVAIIMTAFSVGERLQRDTEGLV